MSNSIKEMERERKNRVIEKHNLALSKLSQRLAFQIFLLVADADGNIDPKEIAGFKTFLHERAEHSSNPYTQRIFHLTLVNYQILSERYLKGGIKKDIDELKKTMQLIEKCVSSKLMERICHDLEDLASSIASASGGFLGISNPVSDEENQVLKKIKKIFKESIQNAHGPNDVDPDTFLIIRNT